MISHEEFMARNGHLSADPAVMEPPRVRAGGMTEMLLAAAKKLDSPFTVQDLTVVAWKMFPRTFGLKGHVAEHPDHNRVVAALCGGKGLVARGLIRRRSDGLLESV